MTQKLRRVRNVLAGGTMLFALQAPTSCTYDQALIDQLFGVLGSGGDVEFEFSFEGPESSEQEHDESGEYVES